MTGNTFDPTKDIPDLSGKVYVVTGGSAGIGFGILAHLLQHHPSKVYLLSRDPSHAESAREALTEYGDVSTLEYLQCDLSSFTQTNTVAQTLLNSLTRLDGLICNAGIGVGPYSLTEDGLDSHMQINHFSQAHLALTLLPLLQKTENSRLVFQSSEMHRLCPSSATFTSLEEMNTDIGPSNLYARTKLAQILFMRELVRRLKAGQFHHTPSMAGPWVNATHPGAVKTDQQDQAVEAYGTPGKIGVKAVRPFMKDPVDEGCRSALFAATSDDVVKEKLHGEYVVPDRKVTDVNKQVKDKELAQNLWKLTKEVLESKLGNLGYVM